MSFVLLCIYISSYFLRFTARVPVLGLIRFDVLIGVIIVLSLFLNKSEDKLRTSIATSNKLINFILYIVVSLPFVTWPGSVINNNLLNWIKVALLFVFIVSIVRTERQLKVIVMLFLCCQAIRILEPLYLHITTGYWGDIAYSHVGGFKGLNRLSGTPFDVVNATQFGWVIVNTIPFLYYLFWESKLINKIIFIVITPVFFYTLLLTSSRSGFLSLLIVLCGIVYFSKQRVKKIIVILVILVPTGVYLFTSVSLDVQNRYFSLVESDVAGADTAHNRVSGLMKQITSVSNNPIFGNGLGTSYETNANIFGSLGKQQLTHNLYIESLQEVGIIGFTLFMFYIISILKDLKKAKILLEQKGKSEDDWLFRCISAIQVWVVMDLFYSLSCFGLSTWEWYFFGGLATVTIALARDLSDNIDNTLAIN